MKNVLIATDFSNASKKAIHEVVNFLKEIPIPSRIVFLNTYLARTDNADDIIKLNDELKKKSLEGLQKEKKEALPLVNNHISIDVSSRMGSLQNVILQMIQKEKFDLIALGKDGGKNVKNISEVLQKYHGPSLLVAYEDI